jgi:hypothetical protein
MEHSSLIRGHHTASGSRGNARQQHQLVNSQRVDPQVTLHDVTTGTLLDRTEYAINTLDPVFERTLVLPRSMAMPTTSSTSLSSDDRFLRFSVYDVSNGDDLSEAHRLASIVVKWSMLRVRAVASSGWSLPLRNDELPETDLRLLRAESTIHLQLRRRLSPTTLSSSPSLIPHGIKGRPNVPFAIHTPVTTVVGTTATSSPALTTRPNINVISSVQPSTPQSYSSSTMLSTHSTALPAAVDNDANELRAVMEEIQRLRAHVDKMRS